MPLTVDDEYEQQVCYPINWEDCDQCEYDEEQSEYYGQEIWHCTA